MVYRKWSLAWLLPRNKFRLGFVYVYLVSYIPVLEVYHGLWGFLNRFLRYPSWLEEKVSYYFQHGVSLV